MHKPLTNENYEAILENHFKNEHIVFCSISTNIKCSNCRAFKRNIDIFNEKHNNVKIFFYYIEYSKYDILQHYYQLNNFMEYPKTIIFYGEWNKKFFVEGPISVEELEEICGIITTNTI